MTIEHEALTVNEIITRFNELNPRQQQDLAFALLKLCDLDAYDIITAVRWQEFSNSAREYIHAHPIATPTK
jgi:hypothetical protein